jgi:hypothetical protein
MLRTLLANKHTSGAAAVYILAKIGCQIAGVWMPEHKAQFDATANYIEAGAVAYGLFAAGDAGQTTPTGKIDTNSQTGSAAPDPSASPPKP